MIHLHQRGIPEENYSKYPKLNEFFKILSTNTIEN